MRRSSVLSYVPSMIHSGARVSSTTTGRQSRSARRDPAGAPAVSIEVDQGKTEELTESKRKLRLAGPARTQNEDPVRAAKSFDLASSGHQAKTTGGVSKMNAGLNVELYAPAA